jgi:hypothetical protein
VGRVCAICSNTKHKSKEKMSTDLVAARSLKRRRELLLLHSADEVERQPTRFGVDVWAQVSTKDLLRYSKEIKQVLRTRRRGAASELARPSFQQR